MDDVILARVTTLVTGLSGLYLVHELSLESLTHRDPADIIIQK